MTNRFTCPQGHQWELTSNGQAAMLDRLHHCPVCGATVEISPGSQPAEETGPAATRVLPGSSGVCVGALSPPSPRLPNSFSESEVIPVPASTVWNRSPGARPLRPLESGYEILGELGRGGMGVVYKARQKSLNRVVALKMLLGGGLAGLAELARFRTEAEAVARLQHPNIVQIHDVGEVDGSPYFSMEFVAGGSLALKLAGKPVPPELAAAQVETLARAVHVAHQAGIVHRDLKPANILVTVEGVLKITDFGLAKRLDAAGPTLSGHIMGTPEYMAPEQACGLSKEIGPAADTYSLGVLLYEMLTGRPPFQGATSLATLEQVRWQEPVPPGRLQPRVPTDLQTICLKTLAKEPDQRYTSALDLAEDLRRFRTGDPILARPVSAWGRGWRWTKRRPALAALLAVSGVALLALVGVGVGASYNAELQSTNQRLEVARCLEQDQRRRAESALADRETYLYFNRIVLAEREWLNNNVGRVEELLADCPTQRRGWEWHYLQRLCHSELYTGRAHTGEVHSVAFSPDGQQFASGGADGTVKLWDAQTGRVRHDLRGHHGWVEGVAFTSDGRLLASVTGTDDLYVTTKTASEVKVWDAATGNELRTMLGHGGAINSVSFQPASHRLATASDDGKVIVWDADTGSQVHVLDSAAEAALGLAFSSDGRQLAASVGRGNKSSRVKVWDAVTGALLRTVIPNARATFGLCFSPDNQHLAMACDDETVKIWDFKDARISITLRGHGHLVRSVAYQPDGQHLASASEDGTVKVWNPQSGEEVTTLRGHRGGGVNGVAFSPDGARLVTVGDDRTVRMWGLQNSEGVLTLGGSAKAVRNLAFHADSFRLATASDDGTARIWELGAGRHRSSCIRSLRGKAANIKSVAFSPDGQLLATAGGDQTHPDQPGELKLWDVGSGQELHHFEGHAGLIGCVTFNRAGSLLASAGADKTVKVWDARTFQLRQTLEGHTGLVTSVAFSPDGKLLASASHDQSARIWEVETGQCRTLDRFGHFVFAAAFSPDGKFLALGCGDRTAKVVDVASGKVVTTLRGHIHNVMGVAFHPDGQRLATLSEDKTVKLWDVATGQELLTLRGVVGWECYNGVAFSPDGQRIAAPGKNGTVKVWNATPLADP